MQPHPEPLILELMNVEPAPAAHAPNWNEMGLPAIEDRTLQDVLNEAQTLLLQFLSLLDDPICEKHSRTVWRLRLARAHARTLFDHVARMIDSP